MLDVLKDQGGRHVRRVAHLVIEWDGIATVLHGLKTHYLAPHLLFLDRFEHLDDNSFIG